MMFGEASAFNQDIANWAVHSVKNMKLMFDCASSFNQDIGGWAVHSVTVDVAATQAAIAAAVLTVIVTTPSPTVSPTPRPTVAPTATRGSDTVDAAHRLSGVSAALLVLVLAA